MMKTVEVLENKEKIMKNAQVSQRVRAELAPETEENAAVLLEEAQAKTASDGASDTQILREIFAAEYAPANTVYAENAYGGVQTDALPSGEAEVLEAGQLQAQTVEAAWRPSDFKYVWMGAGALLLGGLALAGGGGGGGSSGADDQAAASGSQSADSASSGVNTPAVAPKNTSSPAQTVSSVNNADRPSETAAKPATSAVVKNTSIPVQTATPANNTDRPSETASKPATSTASKNTSSPAQTATPADNADNTDRPSETVEKPATPAVDENTQPVSTTQPDNPAVEAVAPQVSPTIPQNAAAKQSGVTLDIARYFYPEETLKQYIDLIAKSGGTFLHLHLSDDENYAFESDVLGQRAADAVRNADGSYTNPATGKPFLSFEQVKSLAAYAKAKGVELVPEVDTPNHMDAVFKLLEISRGKAYTESIKSQNVNDEIDVTRPEAVALVQSLYSEVIGLMQGGSRHFHIGGDEFGYSSRSNSEFVAYANTMAGFLKTKGLTARMWNDGLLKSSLAALDKDIEITYWSYDGNPADAATAAARRSERADADDLLAQGFDILNYNSHYLYMAPQAAAITASGSAQMAAEIQSEWHLGAWDGKTGASVDDTDGVIGASLSIWGDDAATLSAADIFGYSAPAVSALINKTNATAAKAGSAAAKTVAIDAATPFNHVAALDENKAERVEILLSDDLKASGRTFVWLDGQGGDYAVLSEGWQSAGVGELKDGNAYGLYKYGQNHLYIDTDMAVQIV